MGRTNADAFCLLSSRDGLQGPPEFSLIHLEVLVYRLYLIKKRRKFTFRFFLLPFFHQKARQLVSAVLVTISPPFNLRGFFCLFFVIFFKWHYPATHNFFALLSQLFLKKSEHRPVSQYIMLESIGQWFLWNSSYWYFPQIGQAPEETV